MPEYMRQSYLQIKPNSLWLIYVRPGEVSCAKYFASKIQFLREKNYKNKIVMIARRAHPFALALCTFALPTYSNDATTTQHSCKINFIVWLEEKTPCNIIVSARQISKCQRETLYVKCQNMKILYVRCRTAIV